MIEHPHVKIIGKRLDEVVIPHFWEHFILKGRLHIPEMQCFQKGLEVLKKPC